MLKEARSQERRIRVVLDLVAQGVWPISHLANRSYSSIQGKCLS